MSIIVNTILMVKSPAFTNNGNIPTKYTCDGENVNPELNIDELPKETKSLALIVDDPDAPNGNFVHWLMWNIPPKTKIEENTSPGIQGKNSKQENKYYGACPSKGIHHYHFHIYAIDTKLVLPGDTDKSALLRAIDGHILGTGEIIGVYQKP